MQTITVVNDPANITAPDIHHVPDGTRLADWLIAQYGPDGFSVPTAVFIGAIADVNRVSLDDFDAANAPLTEPVYILHCPLGSVLGAVAWVAVAALVAVAVSVLMPVPDLGASGPQAKRSPNNALSGQTNIARLLDRVPDIFGQVRSFPDLIAPTVAEYINHIKFQTEYMCIGSGFYQLEGFRSGETALADIPGSQVAIYPPGTVPDQVLKTRQSNEVSGQELIAPNEVAETALLQSYDVSYNSGTGTATIDSNNAGANVWAGFDPGDTVSVFELYANDGADDYQLSGLYLVDSVTATDLVLTDAADENPNWLHFDGLTAPVLWITGSLILEPIVALPDQVSQRGPFVCPGDNNDQIWLDLIAPSGLAKGSKLDKKLSISLLFTFEEIDDENLPTGPSFAYPITVTDATRSPRFWTFKVGPADGLVVALRYQVTGERLTDSDPGTYPDLETINWSRLAGIENVTEPDTTGTTRVTVETQATQQVAALQERQFNVNATRRTVTYDASTGSVVGDMDTGAGLRASRRMADAFLHYTLDPNLAAGTLAALDADGLYAVQKQIDPVKGEFSYTFDDDNTPALEELRRIAQAARCFVYREGSVYAVTRDQEQTIATGLFNRRNKLPDSETRSVRFNRPLDTDGVTLEYDDIEDGNTRRIVLPDDLPADDPNYGLPATVNPLKVDGIGIRQYAQAWDRAQYELNRLIYRRVTVTTGVTPDGILVPLNGRVQHVDGTRLVALESDGEILTVDGLAVTTTGVCVFTEGVVYSVIVRDQNGDPSGPLVVKPNPATEKGFVLKSPPPFPLVTRFDGLDFQRGSLYTFGPDGNELADAYLVQRKEPDAAGNVRLELINYAVEYYAADNVQPPEKPSL